MTTAETIRRPPTANERFSSELERELRGYAERLAVSDTELVVAISRKAPRLLQLIAGSPELPSVDLSRCITEKALPFIARDALDGMRVLLTDDTIVYGSTFAGVHGKLRAAGARVEGEVLAVSDRANRGVTALVGDGASVMDQGHIQRLIDLEIQAFGALAVPYDIDHPILTLPLRGAELDVIERLERSYDDVWRPTNPWHEAHGVTVVSLQVPDEVARAHSQVARRYGPQKLRLFVDTRRRAVRAVAIFALGVEESALRDPGLFDRAPEPMRLAWRTLLERVEAGGWGSLDLHRALANAAHYLAGCEALWLWMSGNRLGLRSGEGRLAEMDLRLLFGADAARAVHQPLEQFLVSAERARSLLALRLPRRQPQQPLLDVDAEIAQIERGERGAHFLDRARAYLELAAKDDPADLFHALFSAQRCAYDHATRDSGPADPERLNAGLIPFPVVAPLVRALGGDVDDHDLECFADRAIDGGSIVPHYHRSASRPDLWVRGVRAGERGSPKLKHWIHRSLEEAERLYEGFHDVSEDQRGQGVPWYVAEKLFAVLVASNEAQLRSELGKHLIAGRDQFGARAVARELPREPYLLDWAERAGIVASGDRQAGGRMLRADARFRTLYPEREDTVDRSVRLASAQVTGAFLAVEALFTGERRETAILALSSCHSHDAYLESLSAELSVWLHHTRFNVSHLAAMFVELSEDGPERELLRRLQRELHQSAVVVRQSTVKQHAWERRIAVRDTIDRACARDPRLFGYLPVWEQYLRPLFEEEAPADSTAERYLLHAAAVARKAISVARSVLSDHALGEGTAASEGHTAEEHGRELAELVERGRADGLRYPAPPNVAVAALASPDAAIALRATADVLRDAYVAVENIWVTWQRPEPEGTVVYHHDDAVILMWDLIGSSEDPDDAQLTVHKINERVINEGSSLGDPLFINNQDDGHVIKLPSVANALETFLLVAETAASDGRAVRAGVETTLDGPALAYNTRTGWYGGSAYMIAARTMSAFGETTSGRAEAAGFEAAGGVASAPAPPDGSYLMVTERALKQLREHERIEQPPGCTRVGVLRGYRPRVRSALSTDVTVVVPSPRSASS